MKKGRGIDTLGPRSWRGGKDNVRHPIRAHAIAQGGRDEHKP